MASYSRSRNNRPLAASDICSRSTRRREDSSTASVALSRRFRRSTPASTALWLAWTVLTKPYSSSTSAAAAASPSRAMIHHSKGSSFAPCRMARMPWTAVTAKAIPISPRMDRARIPGSSASQVKRDRLWGMHPLLLFSATYPEPFCHMSPVGISPTGLFEKTPAPLPWLPCQPVGPAGTVACGPGPSHVPGRLSAAWVVGWVAALARSSSAVSRAVVALAASRLAARTWAAALLSARARPAARSSS